MGVPFRSLLMPSAAKSSPMPLPLGNLHATGTLHFFGVENVESLDGQSSEGLRYTSS